jgi:putative Holliday junction resolvase
MPDHILGIDYGKKRIGLAIADKVARIAHPLDTLPARNDPVRDARTIADFASARQVTAFVVGLPLQMHEEQPGPQSDPALRFAAELRRLSGLPVHYQDERLTTVAAETVLQEADVPRKKRKELVDRVAAQKILEAWLSRNPADPA